MCLDKCSPFFILPLQKFSQQRVKSVDLISLTTTEIVLLYTRIFNLMFDIPTFQRP